MTVDDLLMFCLLYQPDGTVKLILNNPYTVVNGRFTITPINAMVVAVFRTHSEPSSWTLVSLNRSETIAGC